MTHKSNARSTDSGQPHCGFAGHDFVTAIMWAHLEELMSLIVAHSKSQPPPCQLIYANHKVQIELDHPTWAKQCIYVIMANCEEKPILYIGKAGNTFDRLSPIAKSNTLGHEKVKEAEQALYQVAVFVLEVENLNVETRLIKHFDPIMNLACTSHWPREKHERRVAQILKTIELHPGIVFSNAKFLSGVSSFEALIDELVATGQVDSRRGISDKTGQPCRYLYLVKAASMQHHMMQ